MTGHTYIAPTPDQLDVAAADVLSQLPACPVVALYGTLGAGKTTFVQAVCRLMQADAQATSPTFTIVQVYRKEGEDCLYHFDLYRLESPDELYAIGYEEYFYSGVPCFIEWPEKAGALLPYPHLRVELEEQENGSRRISVSLIPSP